MSSRELRAREQQPLFMGIYQNCSMVSCNEQMMIYANWINVKYAK